jgi:hypothetical protein
MLYLKLRRLMENKTPPPKYKWGCGRTTQCSHLVYAAMFIETCKMLIGIVVYQPENINAVQKCNTYGGIRIPCTSLPFLVCTGEYAKYCVTELTTGLSTRYSNLEESKPIKIDMQAKERLLTVSPANRTPC